MKPMPLEERLKYLTPEQRAKYDENMRRVEEGRAQSQAAWDANKEREAELRVLGGPAGRYLYGAGMDDFGTPDEIEQLMAEKGVFGAHRELRAKRKGDFKNTVKQSFNVSPVPQIADPSIPGSERAARDAARAPYVSPTAVDGEDRPDRHARGDAARRGARAPGRARAHIRRLSRARPHQRPADAAFREAPGRRVGHRPLARRRAGRCRSLRRRSSPRSIGWRAGRASRRCSTRTSRSRSASRPGSARSAAPGSRASPSSARSPAPATARRAATWARSCAGSWRCIRRRARARSSACGRRRRSRSGPPEGVHIEVLNWRAVAAAVHPKINHPPPVPSPFPYLPATPQELLRAYLDSRRRPARGLLQRAGHRRPAARAGAGRVPHDEPRAEAAVRRRRGADAHARMRARRDRLPRPAGVRRGPRAVGRLPGRGAGGRPLQGPRAAPHDRRARHRVLSARSTAPRASSSVSTPTTGATGARRSCRRTATVGRRFEPLERPRRHAVGPTARRGRRLGAAAARPLRRRPVRRPADAARARLGPRRARRDPDRRGLRGDRRSGSSPRWARATRSSPTRSPAACRASRSASPRPSPTTTRCSSSTRSAAPRRRSAPSRARPASSRSRSAGRSSAGARQGFSLTLGSASSIGHFDAPAGAVGLLCTGTGSGELVVTPGRPGIGTAIAGIVGGALRDPGRDRAGALGR